MTDCILKNANIFDMVNDNPFSGDIYIKDGIIKEIGEIKPAGDVEVIDCTDKYVIPGFIDTHSHPLLFGLYESLVDLRPGTVNNIEDIEKALRAAVQNTPHGEWIVAHGYNELELEENRHITCRELDALSDAHPIYIRHSSAHMGVANSKAFEMAGIDEDTPDPEGGYFSKTDGALDGLLFELPAVEKMIPHLPTPSKSEMVDALKTAEEIYLSKGITTATEACVGLAQGKHDFEAFMEYFKHEGKLEFRLMIDYQLLLSMDEFKGRTFDEIDAYIKTESRGRAVLDSVKLFQDGSIQIHTAALTRDYHDVDTKSGIIIPPKKLNELYMHFAELGFPITTHANGDAAIKSVIEGYKFVNENSDHRKTKRIEHIQTGEYDDIAAMKDAGIDGSFFTNHIHYYGDQHYERFLGPERSGKMNPARWAEDLGVLYTLHSDCPVTPISPMDNIRIASDRKTKSGRVLGEDMRLSRMEALRAMTVNGAKLNCTEEKNGTIETGKTGSLVILNRPPSDDGFEISDEQIETVIAAGSIIHV